MIRRSQSVRNRGSHSVTVSDDLGVLREGDHIEDALRQDLADARREKEKLQSQVDSLSAALRARPPIEKVQELEKEFQNLELLLHGTQRENERAMAELERLKNREKLMERELKRFLGDDWEDTLSIGNTFSSLQSSRPIGSTLSAPVVEKSNSSPASVEATLAHMEQIRMMLMGMTERLQIGEEKLQQAIDRADQEKTQLDNMLKSEMDVPA